MTHTYDALTSLGTIFIVEKETKLSGQYVSDMHVTQY